MALKAEVEKRVAPLGRKVYAIVNYAHCSIDPAVFESYSRMVEGLVRDYDRKPAVRLSRALFRTLDAMPRPLGRPVRSLAEWARRAL